MTDAADFMSRTLGSWQDRSKVCPTSPFDGNFQVRHSKGQVLRRPSVWSSSEPDRNGSSLVDDLDVSLQVCYSAGGLPYLTKWGTLRHALNAAFGATLQAKALAAQGSLAAARTQRCAADAHSGEEHRTSHSLLSPHLAHPHRVLVFPLLLLRCWARGLLMYAAGSNVKSQSYIVGYTPTGTKAADRPHHRSSSCSPDYSVACNFNNLNAAVSSVHHPCGVGGLPENDENVRETVCAPLSLRAAGPQPQRAEGRAGGRAGQH